MRRVKIITTLGPASYDLFGQMAHMTDAVRLNFSHGNFSSHKKEIELIRKADDTLPIIMDTAGPEIRVKTPLNLDVGINSSEIKTTPDVEFLQGDKLLIDDGLFEVNVTKQGLVSNFAGEVRKGAKIVVVGRDVSLNTITEKDRKDIEFAVEQGCDAVALSFTRSAEDMIQLYSILEEMNALDVWTIPKIEHSKALENLTDIIKISNGVMVARGDLALHIPFEKVPLVQKRILKIARELRRPSIVATQMLKSMVNNVSPTRAEVSDIVNAVMDGTDCLMLSNETASGKFPIESLEVMNKVARGCELNQPTRATPMDMGDEMALSATKIAERTNSAIYFKTHDGRTARRISKFRPLVPIFADSESKRVNRNMRLLWGIKPRKPEKGHIVEVCHLTEEPAIKIRYLGNVLARGSGFGSGRLNGIIGKTIRIVKSKDIIPDANGILYQGRISDKTFQEIIKQKIPAIATKDFIEKGKHVTLDFNLGVVTDFDKHYDEVGFKDRDYKEF